VKAHLITRKQKDGVYGAALVAPSMIFLALVLGYPLYYLFKLALSKVTWDAGHINQEWVGFTNFVTLFRDDYFWEAFRHTGHLVVLSVPIAFLLALGIALALDKIIHGRAAFLTILLLPWMIAPALSASMWRWLYNDQFGIIGYVMTSLGIVEKPILWLADSKVAIYSIVICDVWQYTPFCIVLLYAGLQDIPSYLYEAAKIDGANAWQLLKYITFPQLRPVIFFILLIRTIFTLRIFDFVYTLTKGGPARSTEVLATFLYKNAFQYMKLDYSATIAIALLLITVAFSIGFFALFKQDNQ
jgi:multiple sugar transport system permease protein